MTVKMRKVLMLHGYAESAAIFSKRLSTLRKAWGSDIELVFVDGPLKLNPVDLVKSCASIETFEASETSDSTDPALAPRGWWQKRPDGQPIAGLDQSLELLRDVLKNDRFDGVFGFSQGAALAAILSALLERPHAYPAFLVNGEAPHPPFEFCVAVSGFRPVIPLSDTILLPFYSTPTLHVLGRTDVVIEEERSNKLIVLSTNKRVEHHPGGHFVPSKTYWRTFLRDYMCNPSSTDLPPRSAASSQPTLGNATPFSPSTF